MTAQDREWVKAMIQSACSETLAKVSDEIRELPGNCPVIAKLRIGLIGIALGLIIAGGSAGAALVKLIP